MERKVLISHVTEISSYRFFLRALIKILQNRKVV